MRMGRSRLDWALATAPRAVAHVAPMRGLWAGFLLSALVLANAEQVAAAAAPGGAAQAAQPSYHVVVVHNSDEVTVESIVSVITDKLGATREKAMPLIEKIDSKGKAVVVMGTKATCDEAAAHFNEIGMKSECQSPPKAQ